MIGLTRRIFSAYGNTIRVAVSLLMVGIAIYTLHALLRDIDLGKVAAALKAQSGAKIASAGLFVIAGYITLTFYDVFALRMIGRRNVPYAIAALASFTSATIGHNLGAAVLTSALVRLRTYSAWGLTVLDIAKIGLFTGMTFWLGNALLIGVSITYAPEAAGVVDHLPAWVNRLAGLSVLAMMGGYLLWLTRGPRGIGRASWRVTLPSPRLTLLQTAIGATDLTFVTLAMYVLLPASPAVGFASVLVIFLTAALLGIVSHAPAGLGIIEAMMLIGLPQFGKEELLAALLTFRVVYFVIPLLLAALALALRELRMLARPAPAEPAPRLLENHEPGA